MTELLVGLVLFTCFMAYALVLSWSLDEQDALIAELEDSDA